MYLRLLEPYVNFVKIDGKRRELFWCNGTFSEAIRFYKYKFFGDIEFREILESITSGFLPEIYESLLYGAFKMAMPQLSPESFAAMPINELEAVEAVADGVNHYLPQNQDTDIEAFCTHEKQGGIIDWDLWYKALGDHGLRPDDIKHMTFRAMDIYLFGSKDDSDELHGYGWLLEGV